MATEPTTRAQSFAPSPVNTAPAEARVEPLLISAAAAAQMCGRSVASWWRDHSAGRIPAPLKLGGRTFWRAEELRRWIEVGCPPRKLWEGLRGSRGYCR
jgi:predicted DNA-binding transcriptional regulator AlpA